MNHYSVDLKDYKEYKISNTSSLFMSLLKNKKIPHELTEDGKCVKVYVYCDTDLLELGQTFQLVLNTIHID